MPRKPGCQMAWNLAAREYQPLHFIAASAQHTSQASHKCWLADNRPGKFLAGFRCAAHKGVCNHIILIRRTLGTIIGLYKLCISFRTPPSIDLTVNQLQCQKEAQIFNGPQGQKDHAFSFWIAVHIIKIITDEVESVTLRFSANTEGDISCNISASNKFDVEGA